VPAATALSFGVLPLGGLFLILPPKGGTPNNPKRCRAALATALQIRSLPAPAAERSIDGCLAATANQECQGAAEASDGKLNSGRSKKGRPKQSDCRQHRAHDEESPDARKKSEQYENAAGQFAYGRNSQP